MDYEQQDPSAQRDADRAPSPIRGHTPFDPFKDFLVESGGLEDTSRKPPPQKSNNPLERVANQPDSWGQSRWKGW